VVVENDQGATWLARFDGRGEPAGEPEKIELGGVPLGPVHLARVGGAWAALRPQGQGVVAVGRGPAPAEDELEEREKMQGGAPPGPAFGGLPCHRVFQGGEGAVAVCHEPEPGLVGLRVTLRFAPASP
jgi:hypothetical protein